jgi:hypothetical protein
VCGCVGVCEITSHNETPATHRATEERDASEREYSSGLFRLRALAIPQRLA